MGDSPSSRTAAIDLSQTDPIPPAFATPKLLAHTFDHHHHSELWPHPIWDLELNTNSAIWNQLLKSAVHQVQHFHPIPASIFDLHSPPAQESHPSSASSPRVTTHTFEYDHSSRWDARLCVGCSRGIFHSPIEAAVPSVFDRNHAHDLIHHAKKYNHLPNHVHSKTNPEQLVYKAWHTVFIVAQNALLEGKLSPLPLNGKSISGRMPWDSISRNALRTLVEANPTNELLRAVSDSANSAAEQKANLMDLNKAYATLGDVVPEVDDEMLWMAYTIGVADQPGQKDVLREALQVIARHRKSHLIESRLVAELKGDGAESAMDIVAYSPPPVSYDLPAGINNIGNSLLQYFFSVRELREILLRFPEFEQDIDEH
ncbi:hypothetical protein PtB15_6B486 [Puccinia triticina]|nr:hypothetical protein PtB15_6B486 [Puccinia triticina]